MHKLLITALCILFIHITRQAYCIDQLQNDFINNILNKLKTSKNFDVIADIIAEKAARKILSLNKIDNTQPKHGETNKQGNLSFKQKATEDDMMNNETEESKPQSGSLINNKLFRINPKVFIQLDASHPEEELSLNYKYLMKKTRYNIDHDIKDTVENSEKYKKIQSLQKNYNENEDRAYINKNNNKDDKNKGNKYLQVEHIVKNNHSDESLKIRNLESNEEEEKVKISSNYRKEKTSNNGQDEGQSTNEKNDSKNSDETPHRIQEHVMKQRSEIDNLQSARISNEINENKSDDMNEEYSEEKLKPYQGGNEMSILERKEYIKKNNKKYNQMNEDQVTIDNVIPQVTQTMSTNQIREEAGKQLIYAPAPEYQEYFEKLAKSKAPNIEKFLT